MRTLAREIDGLELPAVEKISESQKQDPFQILISTLLSARTQDATTLAASTRLFAKARTPEAVAKLRVKQIEKLIYPVSFYRNKAVFVRDAAKDDRREIRRPGAGDARGDDHAARRRPQDRQPRDDPRLQEQREHLRRHSRAPHRQPSGLGADAHAGRDRAGALQDARAAMVAGGESLSRDLGSECLPSGVPSLRSVSAAENVPPNRSAGGVS